METTEAVKYPWDQDGYYQEYHNRMRMIALQVTRSSVDSVLDLGCGHGKMRHLLPDTIAYFGCDGHWEQAPYEDAEYSHWLFEAKSPQLPFEGRQFGAITCSGLIEYIDAQPALFRAIFERLQPGGVFLCSAINPLFLRFLMGKYKLPKGKWHPAWHEVRPYRAILKDIRQAGFQLDSYAWVPEHQNSESLAKEAIERATPFAKGEALPSFLNFSNTQILFIAHKP